MANWKYKLSLKDFYNDDSVSIQNKAKLVAKKISKVLSVYINIESPKYDLELDEIKEEFEWLANDVNANADDFDCVMERLYDWADYEIEPFDKWPPNKRCWIDTR